MRLVCKDFDGEIYRVFLWRLTDKDPDEKGYPSEFLRDFIPCFQVLETEISLKPKYIYIAENLLIHH